MTKTYELRTMRNRPVSAFDNVARAKDELHAAEKRIGTKLKLVEITRIEKEISL